MNISSPKKSATTRRGFTLTDLLVVLGMTALLATVLLSAAFTTQERALRAECVSNLRQIGVGLNLYSADRNGYLPLCVWPYGQNPWQTYEACRVNPADGSTITRGYENLGLLFRTKVVSSAKIFYCPSYGQSSWFNSYDYYATGPNGWPSTPVGLNDDNVRTGYNYYPQLRATENANTSYGNFILPKLSSSGVNVQLEVGLIKVITPPAKLTDVNPNKSVAVDSTMSFVGIPHKASGSVVGLNALFPDGRVTFQPVRNHNKKNSFQPYDPNLWSDLWGGPGPGSDPDAFRIIMNGWTP